MKYVNVCVYSVNDMLMEKHSVFAMLEQVGRT